MAQAVQVNDPEIPPYFAASLTELVRRLGGHVGDEVTDDGVVAVPSAGHGVLEQVCKLCEQAHSLMRRLYTDPYDRRHLGGQPYSWAGVADYVVAVATGLAVVGHSADAVFAAEQVVALYRWLASDGEKASTPLRGPHANALLALADLLDVEDSRAEALAATAEAVDLHRQVGVAADLARSLDLLSVRLGRSGRHDDAGSAEAGAVRFHQQLIADHGDSTDPETLLGWLSLAIRLDMLGRQPDAADARRGAAQAYQRFVDDNPGNPLAGLARSLHTLAFGVGTDWPGPECVAALVTARAVQADLREVDAPAGATLVYTSLHLLRQLWGDHDARVVPRITDDFFSQTATGRANFLPEVAACLTSLATTLAGKDRHDEALVAAGEAVTIWRLVAAYDREEPVGALTEYMVDLTPHEYRKDSANELARALELWAFRLSDLGRHDEALAAMAESLDLQKAGHGREPVPDLRLLSSRLNLGALLSRAGYHQEALAIEQDVVAACREQAGTLDPHARFRLAQALNNLACTLGRLGQWEEALSHIDEALSIHRQLASEPGPSAIRATVYGYGHHHRIAQLTLAETYDGLGRSAEAAEIRQRLAT